MKHCSIYFKKLYLKGQLALASRVSRAVFSEKLQVKSCPHPLLGCSHLPSLWLCFFPQGKGTNLGAIQAVGCAGISFGTAQ